MASKTIKQSGATHKTSSFEQEAKLPRQPRIITGNIRTTTLKKMESEVMKQAKASGLLNEKNSRITGRVSTALVEQAKRRTGITENTQLIEFALANLALEDNFDEAFKAAKGTVASEIKLGF